MGHHLDEFGIQQIERKVTQIQNTRRPKSKKDLGLFLGLLSQMVMSKSWFCCVMSVVVPGGDVEEPALFVDVTSVALPGARHGRVFFVDVTLAALPSDDFEEQVLLVDGWQ